MKFFLMALCVLVFASPVFAAGQATLDTTATDLYLAQYPFADLTNADVQTRIGDIKQELQLLFPAVLTVHGQQVFTSTLPYVAGEVILGLDDTTKAKITALQDSNHAVDLKTKAGSDVTLTQLATLGGLKISILPYESIILSIDPKANAFLVAKNIDDAKIPGIKYASSDAYMRNGSKVYRTALPHEILYSFYFGWGDCPAGCTEYHYEFYELDGSGAKHLASSGESLAAGTDIFK